MILVLIGTASGSATITVCPSGCEYSSIQKAIKASSNGDTILVQSGTYFENVKVNKQLTIRGIGNPVVDAGGNGNVITLSANGITLEGFTTTWSGYSWAGIKVTSSNNTLTGNNGDISLSSSNNNTLTDNNGGISLSSSSNNMLKDNNASNNRGSGIYLEYASSNTLIGNNASNNSYGIQISTDRVSEDGEGEYYCTNNTLKNNIMTGNMYNFELDVHRASDFQNQIDKSNLVDGKPIYYILGASNIIYDSSTNAGTFYCINCLNVTLKDLNLTNNGYGVFFWNTTLSKNTKCKGI